MHTTAETLDPFFYIANNPCSASGELPPAPIELFCVDDRPRDGFMELDESTRRLVDRLQLPAGPKGIAKDITVAAAMNYENELPNNFPSVPWLAKAVGAALTPRGVDPLLHDNCAAEGGAIAIAEKIIAPEHRQSVWNASKQVYPDIQEQDFMACVKGTETMLKRGSLLPYEQSASYMECSGCQNCEHYAPALGRATLHDAKHAATSFVVGWDSKESFDTAGAWADGKPAYHTSLGKVENLARNLNEGLRSHGLTIQPKDLLTAAVVRAATVATLLPVPGGGTMEIIRREPNYARV